MKSKIPISVGVVVFFVGLWGASYLGHVAERPQCRWMEFPAVATGYALCLGGLALVALGIYRNRTW